jgi:hypothetical protein
VRLVWLSLPTPEADFCLWACRAWPGDCMAGWGKDDRDRKRERRLEEHRIIGLIHAVVALAVAAVAYTDWVVVANVSLGYLYVLPISISVLINPLPFTVALAVVCTVLTDIFGPPAESLNLRVVHNVIGLPGGGISW